MKGSTDSDHDLTLKKTHKIKARVFTSSVISRDGFLLYYDLNKLVGFDSFYKTVARHTYDKLAIYSEGGTKKVGIKYADLVFIDACLSYAGMLKAFENVKDIVKGVKYNES